MSFVCLRRDLKEGEWNTFKSFKNELIATVKQDKVVLSKNQCKHRGFKVAEGCGKGMIKCPYHGQRFDFDRKVNHYEMGEFVFQPMFLNQSKELVRITDELGEEFGRNCMTVYAPFHLWMQNTADPNHLQTAHKKSFAQMFDNHRPENVFISEFESSYTMRIKDEVVERYQKHFPEASSDFYHYLGFPNLSVTSFLGVFYSVEWAEPLGDDKCEVTTRFFARAGAKRNTLLERMALEANKELLDEDRLLVEDWSRSWSNSTECQWLPGEERIKAYTRQLLARGLG